MRRPDAVLYGVAGQSLALLVRAGRPTAATFDVFAQYASDDETPVFSGTATIDAVNTTLTGYAGPTESDPQRLDLDSTAGIVVGRRYLLEQSQRKEWVEFVEVGAGYARSRHPVQGEFSPGATLEGVTLTAAVDDAWAADVSNLSDMSDPAPDYRVKWDVTVGSAQLVIYSFFDLVRSGVDHGVDIEHINARAPGLVDSLPTEYRLEAGRPLIDGAWAGVRADFVSLAIDPNAVRDPEVVDELVILRTLRSLAEGGWAPAGVDKTAYLGLTRDNYDRFFERHFKATLRHRVDTRSGALPFWSK
jgi:hypothetical protein